MNCFSTLPVRASLFALALLAGQHAVQAQGPVTGPAVRWDKTFGGSGEDRITVVREAHDGGFLLGGFSQSPVSGSKTSASLGGFDYWVVKVDSLGAKQWEMTYGGNNEDRLTCLEQTADKGFILGGYSSSGATGSKTQGNQGGIDYWVVKIDSLGVKQWDKTFGGNAEDRLNSVEQTADGGYILGGRSDSGTSTDKSQPVLGGFDYWIVKLDGTGTKVWDKTLGGNNVDVLNVTRATRDGGYILGGFSYSGVSGDKTEPNSAGPEYDYWVVKVDGTGTKVWDKTFGGTGPDQLTSLQQTVDGGYLAGGFSNSPISPTKSEAPKGNFDNWIIKIRPDGSEQWDKTLGGDDYDQLNSLYQTADNGYILGGFSYSNASGDKTDGPVGAAGTSDFWMVKVDSLGTKQWDKTFGGTQEDQLSSLRQTRVGGYILGGISNSPVSGAKTQAGEGNYDFWALKLGRAAMTTATSAPKALALASIYPNPAHGSFTVQLPVGSPRTGLQARLFDATGRLVWAQALAASADSRHLLQVGTVPAGLYLLRLEGPAGYAETQRLVLE